MFGIELRVHNRHRAIPRGVLALVLLQIMLLAALALNRAQAATPSSPSSTSATPGVRQFYLTRGVHNGALASTACAEGYHFASIWEIADPSSLRYNTALGAISLDSGAGPPTASKLFTSVFVAHGWVRTGYENSYTGSVGQANCGTWISMYYGDLGTVANLPSNWTAGTQDVGVWNTEVRACDTNVRVWCVQDDIILPVFLPLVLKDSP